MFKYALFVLIAFCITALLFIIKPTERTRSRILIICFVFQLFIPQILKQSVSGIESGGSALYNLVLVASWTVPTILLVYQSSRIKENAFKQEFENSFFISWLVVISWLILFLLECIYVYFSPTKLVPIASTITFFILFYLSIVRPINSNVLLEEMTKIASLLAIILLIGFISRFKYFGSNEFDVFDENFSYLSPLNLVFDLPSRLAGPFLLFGGPQIMGLFFTFAQACNGLRINRRGFWIYSCLLFLAGSATGSRTFYLVFFLTTLSTNFFSVRQKKFSNLIKKSAIVVMLVLVSFYLGKILAERSKISGQNLRDINGRRYIWEAVLQHWNDQGYFGHGPGQFRKLVGSYVGFPAAHAHNSFLEYLWNYGVVGGFAILSVYISMIILSLRMIRVNRAPLILMFTLLAVFTERNLRLNMQDIVGLFWIVLLNILMSQKQKHLELTYSEQNFSNSSSKFN